MTNTDTTTAPAELLAGLGDLHTADPKAIDAALAQLHGIRAGHQRTADSAAGQLRNSLGYRSRYLGRARVWDVTLDEAVAEARADLATEAGKIRAWDRRSAADAVERHDAAVAAIADADQAMTTLATEYARRPWARFFLVTSSNGHIHSSMACSTCHITTGFDWLPELSDETEAEAVAAHGALLCTVCFPSAPVEWTNHYEQLAAEKAASECAGSRSFDYTDASPARSVSRYATCSSCSQRVSLTSTGKMRAHKPTAAR